MPKGQPAGLRAKEEKVEEWAATQEARGASWASPRLECQVQGEGTLEADRHQSAREGVAYKEDAGAELWPLFHVLWRK